MTEFSSASRDCAWPLSNRLADGSLKWLDRLDYRYSYMGHTTQMKRPASEYFARNIWISADPTKRTLPYMIELVGDDKFFIGSDYPHAEGFTNQWPGRGMRSRNCQPRQ